MPTTETLPDVHRTKLAQRSRLVRGRLQASIGDGAPDRDLRMSDPGFDIEDRVQVAVVSAWRVLSSVSLATPEQALDLA